MNAEKKLVYIAAKFNCRIFITQTILTCYLIWDFAEEANQLKSLQRPVKLLQLWP